jgi:hypothetical protein
MRHGPYIVHSRFPVLQALCSRQLVAPYCAGLETLVRWSATFDFAHRGKLTP